MSTPSAPPPEPVPIGTMTVDAYLRALAAKVPAPGGGAAAALTLAQAASLASMVLEYTVGKAKFADHDAANRARLRDAARIREDALALADADARAYEALNALQRKPDAPRPHLAEATARAIAVPHDLMALAALLLGALREYPGATSAMLASDVRVAALLAHAACRAARANVEVNLLGLAAEDRAGIREKLQLVALEERASDALAAIEVALG